MHVTVLREIVLSDSLSEQLWNIKRITCGDYYELLNECGLQAKRAIDRISYVRDQRNGSLVYLSFSGQLKYFIRTNTVKLCKERYS